MSFSAMYQFKNGPIEGSAPLNEIVQKFESKAAGFDHHMWIKGPQDVYWTILIYHKEAVLLLNWDFINRNKDLVKRVKGQKIIELFERGELKENSHVKVSASSDWKRIKYTSFGKKEVLLPPFSGLSAEIPDYKYKLARVIDFLIYRVLPYLILYFISESLIIFFVVELFFPLSQSFWEAFCVSKWGTTLGFRLMGLSILNTKGKPLSFSLAYRRQFILNLLPNRRRFLLTINERFSYFAYPFGATQWDQNNECIVTKRVPQNRGEHLKSEIQKKI